MPAALIIAAISDVPLTMFFVYRLLTRHRRSLVNDEVLERTIGLTVEATNDLKQSLRHAGVDSLSLTSGNVRLDQNMRIELAKLLATVEDLRSRGGGRAVPQSALLNAAIGLMAEQRWTEAAQYFDQYVRDVDAEWDIHYARGAAHANSRLGAASEVAAMRAYSDAIALLPAATDPNVLARLVSYRAACAKRLGRLEQAEADLRLGRRLATEDYEMSDIAYNFASVYALAGRRSEVLDELRLLRDLGAIGRVLPHLHDYFRSLRDDPEFLEIIGRRA